MKRRVVLAMLAAAVSHGSAREARADVVPAPPACAPYETSVPDHHGGHCEASSCPAGKVLFTGDEGYPRCFDPPPVSCPAGWTPVPGPRCALALCDDARPCGGRTTCRATAVCTGEVPRDQIPWGSFSPRALLFGNIQLAQYRGPCGPEATCPDGGTCREVRVCLPRGERVVAPPPGNALLPRRLDAFPEAERVLTAVTMHEVLASEEPPAKEGPPPFASAPVRPVEVTTVAPTPAPGRAGCAGCTVAEGRARTRVSWLGVLGVVVLVLRRRARVCCRRWPT